MDWDIQEHKSGEPKSSSHNLVDIILVNNLGMHITIEKNVE